MNWLKKTRNKKFKNSGIDILESTLNGIGGVVPIGSILSFIRKGYMSHVDYYYNRKLEQFLRASDDVNTDEKERFIAKLGENYDKVNDYLHNLLLNAEAEEKAFAMGLIYKAAVRDEIDEMTMLRLCSIINRSFIADLHYLPEYVETKTEGNEITDAFTILGLISLPEVGVYHGYPSYQLNDLGLKLHSILSENNWFNSQE